MGTREAIRGHRYGFVAVFAAVALTLIVTAAVGVGFVLNADGGGVSAQTDAGEAFTGTTDLADAETTFRGNDSGDKAGYEVASAGDVNGDGVRDVLVGAPYADTGDDADENAGAVYLFYGPVDAGNVNVSEADVTFHGAPGDVAGWSIAAGNLDGDNYSDVVVGAPYSDGAADDPANDSGVVYVAEGGEDLPEQVNLSTDADATYRGVEAGDEAGYSVATVEGAGVEFDAGETADGETDGETDDGNATDALLVGAPYANTTDVDAGAGYLVENVTDGEHALDAAANVTYAGATARDQAGWSVADAGDVNDDGSHEVVIAAPFNHTGNASYAGDVSILSTDYEDGETVPITQGHTYHGVGEDDRAGWSVSTAGDVNDDGFADVVVGAPYNDSAGNHSGVAYLLHGGEDLPGNESLDDAAAVLRGEDAGDRAGWAVSDAGSGDVDCNGYDDVLVGAPYRNSTAVHAGTAYVVHGGEGTGVGSLDDAGAELRGEGAGDRAGWSVAAANDSTGDDAKDVLVGATHNDTNDANAGAAYLVAGDCPVKPTEEDIDRPTEPPRDDETPDETPTETPTPDETPTETPDPTPEPPQPNASLSIDCVDEQTVVNVSATDLGDRNVTVAFNSTNDTADFNRTFQPDANDTVDERINVSDESNATVTVHLGDNVSGDVLAEANVTVGECDLPSPTASVTTECLDDQTNRITVEAGNLSDRNVTVAFDSENDTADFNRTFQPDANGMLDERINVSDEYNATVAVYPGDNVSGEPLDETDLLADECGQDEPTVEPVEVTDECVDGQGQIRATNGDENETVSVELRNGTEVVGNASLDPGENHTWSGLSNGTYTVVTIFDGEDIADEDADVGCAPVDDGDDLQQVDVTTGCLIDDPAIMSVTNQNANDSVDVVISTEDGVEIGNTTLSPDESDDFRQLTDGNYTIETIADGETIDEQVVEIDCESEQPSGPDAPDGNETNGTDSQPGNVTNGTDSQPGNETETGADPPVNDTNTTSGNDSETGDGVTDNDTNTSDGDLGDGNEGSDDGDDESGEPDEDADTSGEDGTEDNDGDNEEDADSEGSDNNVDETEETNGDTNDDTDDTNDDTDDTNDDTDDTNDTDETEETNGDTDDTNDGTNDDTNDTNDTDNTDESGGSTNSSNAQ